MCDPSSSPPPMDIDLDEDEEVPLFMRNMDKDEEVPFWIIIVTEAYSEFPMPVSNACFQPQLWATIVWESMTLWHDASCP